MAPKMLQPTAQEITAAGLDMVFACATRVLMQDPVLEALSARIGAPPGVDYNIVSLAQLTQAERTDTVENMQVSDGAQPPVHRAPTIFEKSMARSLFNLVDTVQGVLTAAPA